MTQILVTYPHIRDKRKTYWMTSEQALVVLLTALLSGESTLCVNSFSRSAELRLEKGVPILLTPIHDPSFYELLVMTQNTLEQKVGGVRFVQSFITFWLGRHKRVEVPRSLQQLAATDLTEACAALELAVSEDREGRNPFEDSLAELFA